jgi:hypothetical protein
MLIHTCHAHSALCRGLDKSLSERHGRGKTRVRHRRGMACVNQTRPHCVNQMGKTQTMAGERHGMCELAFTLLVNIIRQCTKITVFVYHVKSPGFNSVGDSIHKRKSPPPRNK